MTAHEILKEWEGHFVCRCGFDFPTRALLEKHRTDRADVKNMAGFLKSLAEPILNGTVSRLNRDYVEAAVRLARTEWAQEDG